MGAPSGNEATKDQSENEADEVARAILIKNCVRCHGPKRQEGGLRLDRFEFAKLGGDSGAAVTPGKIQESLILKRVSDSGAGIMPPDGKTLSMEEIQNLTRWVERGANWPEKQLQIEHQEAYKTRVPWSFKPVTRSEIPIVRDNSRVRNEIDSFAFSEHERHGLAASVDTDKRTLIRRLSLDLLGLPPTNEEVESFVQDEQVDAYEKLVDRLLASPQFGERWGRHWLDRSNYAESSGCLVDLIRPYAWRWREWVVNSMNSDQPFDLFTMHQIAGDVLPDATRESRVATGFYRNALTNIEPGIDLEDARSKTTVDRVVAVGSAWLGLTLGCAECHSHKYDPISQRDFYRLYAFFDRMDDRVIDAPARVDSSLDEQARQNLAQATSTYIRHPAQDQDCWEASIKSLPDIWKLPRDWHPRSFRSERFAMVHPQADGSMTVDGVTRSSDRHQVEFRIEPQTIRALRIELLADKDRFQLGPGRCDNGACIMTGIAMEYSDVDTPAEKKAVTFAKVDVDYCQTGYSASDAWAKSGEGGWATDQQGVSHAAVFHLESPIQCKKPSSVNVRLEFQSGRGRTPIRFRVAFTDKENSELDGQFVPGDIRELIARDKATRSDPEKVVIKRYFQSTRTPQAGDLIEWNLAAKACANFLNPRGAECVSDSWQERQTHIHLRGNLSQRGDLVQPGVPAVFENTTEKNREWGRLELAKWLASPNNPLTARVAVNDIWQHLFGAGLVRTPDDFGSQGERPTHPELLDWLAHQFVQDQWSRKRTIRRIVLSTLYRQSSQTTPNAAAIDPDNRMLTRQMRIRLDAEAIRDCQLAVAGLLNLKMGGPSFRNPVPDEYPTEAWEIPQLSASSGDEFRRGIYMATLRTHPDPFLVMFDAPDGSLSCPLRQSTNTPLQALALLNDHRLVASARQLAHQESLRSDVPPVGIERLWTRCTGRLPTQPEAEVLVALHRRVLHLPGSRSQTEQDRQQAAWFVVARTILNLDETYTRE